MILQQLGLGQQLPDGSIMISGSLPFTMSINIEDRKVIGKETMTVPAGTFEAYITYTTKTNP